MSNQAGDGGTGTTPTVAVPKNAPPVVPDNSHAAFLLLMGQVIGVLVLAWIAGMSDLVGRVIVALFVVMWLMWVMNRSDVLQQWGAKVGL